QAPRLREGGARLLDRPAPLPVDHPPVVLGDLLPQPRRRLRLEVAELVDSAALNRDASSANRPRALPVLGVLTARTGFRLSLRIFGHDAPPVTLFIESITLSHGRDAH